jgi:acetyltransferase-like isoleucine patch superfamily enzyme/glycosyltransferase involved in cell wall biosynthesis
MKVLLITMSWPDKADYNLYTDLMQEFIEQGHQVTVLTANEWVKKQKTHLSYENKMQVLRVRTGNIQKTNKYCKVIFSFLANPQIIYAVHKYLKNQTFHLILFTTPPITLSPSVVLLKRIYKAKLYLLLKDIWPQDTVDLGAMRKGGIVWLVFRYLEIFTYKNSDYIGCMSKANVEYVKRNNKYLKGKIIEECPNSQKMRDLTMIDRDFIREKYDLPKDKTILVYGGNLGKSQGIGFLVDIIHSYKDDSDYFFLIVGSGTEYDFLYKSINSMSAQNAKLLPWIQKKEFIQLIQACDMGLILLDKKNTVPNFPSRLLTYLNAKIPIIAAVDKATDIGDIIESAGCGVKTCHGDIDGFRQAAEKMKQSEAIRKLMGEKGYQLLLDKYSSDKSYKTIMEHFQEEHIEKEIKEQVEKQNKVMNGHNRFNNHVPEGRGSSIKKLKSFILSFIFKLINFICYGDLPTTYYLKKGMKIGRNFHRQTATKFDPAHCYLIEIGDNVTVANNVQILAHDQSARVYLGYGKVGRVVIGNKVFIGARTLILPGVIIGNNAIIGAGSVVTKSIPDNSVAVGVPARVIGTTSDYLIKYKKELLTKPKFNKSYSNSRKLSKRQKAKIIKTCKEGYAYIELGKVIEYGRRNQTLHDKYH